MQGNRMQNISLKNLDTDAETARVHTMNSLCKAIGSGQSKVAGEGIFEADGSTRRKIGTVEMKFF